MRKRKLIGIALTLPLPLLVAAPAISANYVSANGCDATLQKSWTGQSNVIAACGNKIGGNAHQARGAIDCTSAPDRYTSWIKANGRASSGYCAFGARGVSLEFK